jgi:transcription elongation factor Elf1
MALRDYLRWVLPGGKNMGVSDDPTFRCLRCGAEYERQYDTCSNCGVRFIIEVPDE